MVCLIILGVSTFTFLLSRALPSSPVEMMLGSRPTAEQVAQARQELGLDRPLIEQMGRYYLHLARGQFGTSLRTGRPVIEEIGQRLSATVELVTLSLLLALTLGIPLGILTAAQRGRRADQWTRVAAISGVAIPVFFLGILLQMLFYGWLGWLPLQGRIDSNVLLDHPVASVTGLLVLDSLLAGNMPALRSALSHLALPTLTLMLASLATILRATRTLMIDVLETDYIRTARAYGLPASHGLFRAGAQAHTGAAADHRRPDLRLHARRQRDHRGVVRLARHRRLHRRLGGHQRLPGGAGRDTDRLGPVPGDQPGRRHGVFRARPAHFDMNSANPAMSTTPGLSAALRCARWCRGNLLLASCIGGLALIVLLALLAPWLGLPDPTAIDFSAKLRPPGAEHWFGTDGLGRDIFSGVVYGARVSLLVAVGVVVIAAAIGIPIGLLAGYAGGWIDAVCMRISDVFLAFPPLLLPITLSALLGPGLFNAMLAVAISWFPWYARIIRASVLSVKSELYVYRHAPSAPARWSSPGAMCCPTAWRR